MAKKASKSRARVKRAMREVFRNPPSTVKAKGKTARRRQKIAIALRKAGVPRKRGK